MRPRRGGGQVWTAVLAAAAMTAAGPAVAAPLPDLIVRTLQRSPQVRAAQAELTLARQEAAVARTAYYPAFGASAGPAADGMAYDLTLSQTLWDWGQTANAVDSRLAAVARQQANLEVVRDDAALELAETYLDLAGYRAQLSLLDDHLQRLAALAEMADARVEGRYADRAESGRVALALASAESDRARLRGEAARAEGRYAILTGAAPDRLRLPEPGDVIQALGGAGALEAAAKASPLYRRAVLAVEVADAGEREALAARWPRLNLEGSVQRREIGGRLVSDTAVSVRFRMSDQGFAAWRRPAVEAARKEAARWEAESVLRDLTDTVGALAAEDQALDARLDALAQRAEQAGAVRDVYREQFMVGRRDIQDLLLMEGEHFEAERQIMELTVQRLRLQYRAAAQLGRLTPQLTGDEMQQMTASL